MLQWEPEQCSSGNRVTDLLVLLEETVAAAFCWRNFRFAVAQAGGQRHGEMMTAEARQGPDEGRAVSRV
jgi:hypothetical protein